MILLLLSSFVGATQAACTPAAVQTAVQEGLLAFAAMDDTGVEDAVGAVDTKVACQVAPLPPGVAAEVHQIHGLAAFLGGDTAGAKAAFSAELALDPTSTLPLKIAPEGGKLARLYAESKVPMGTSSDLSIGADYRGYVDGTEASKRPSDRPAVVQLAEYDVVKYSAWLLPASPLPAQYLLGAAPALATAGPGEPTAAAPKPEKAPPPSKEPRTAKPPKEPGARSGTAFLVAGGAAAVVAGGLFATSVVTHGSFEEDPTKLEYTLNHAGYWGSIGTGAVALGLLTVGIVGSF